MTPQSSSCIIHAIERVVVTQLIRTQKAVLFPAIAETQSQGFSELSRTRYDEYRRSLIIAVELLDLNFRGSRHRDQGYWHLDTHAWPLNWTETAS